MLQMACPPPPLPCCSPYYIVIYVKWRMTWLWRFTIRKEEYGPEEHLYLTRKKLGLSELQWQVREQ